MILSEDVLLDCYFWMGEILLWDLLKILLSFFLSMCEFVGLSNLRDVVLCALILVESSADWVLLYERRVFLIVCKKVVGLMKMILEIILLVRFVIFCVIWLVSFVSFVIVVFVCVLTFVNMFLMLLIVFGMIFLMYLIFCFMVLMLLIMVWIYL